MAERIYSLPYLDCYLILLFCSFVCSPYSFVLCPLSGIFFASFTSVSFPLPASLPVSLQCQLRQSMRNDSFGRSLVLGRSFNLFRFNTHRASGLLLHRFYWQY